MKKIYRYIFTQHFDKAHAIGLFAQLEIVSKIKFNNGEDRRLISHKLFLDTDKKMKPLVSNIFMSIHKN